MHVHVVLCAVLDILKPVRGIVAWPDCDIPLLSVASVGAEQTRLCSIVVDFILVVARAELFLDSSYGRADSVSRWLFGINGHELPVLGGTDVAPDGEMVAIVLLDIDNLEHGVESRFGEVVYSAFCHWKMLVVLLRSGSRCDEP